MRAELCARAQRSKRRRTPDRMSRWGLKSRRTAALRVTQNAFGLRGRPVAVGSLRIRPRQVTSSALAPRSARTSTRLASRRGARMHRQTLAIRPKRPASAAQTLWQAVGAPDQGEHAARPQYGAGRGAPGAQRVVPAPYGPARVAHPERPVTREDRCMAGSSGHGRWRRRRWQPHGDIATHDGRRDPTVRCGRRSLARARPAPDRSRQGDAALRHAPRQHGECGEADAGAEFDDVLAGLRHRSRPPASTASWPKRWPRSRLQQAQPAAERGIVGRLDRSASSRRSSWPRPASVSRFRAVALVLVGHQHAARRMPIEPSRTLMF